MNQNKSKNTLINWELVSVTLMIKTGTGKIYFAFGDANIQSVIGFSLIASLYLVYELNVFIVLFGTLIASILVFFLANLVGKSSQNMAYLFQ